MLAINEEFYSIQGEGYNTGILQYFVRTQGCSVGCYFCDTKPSWKLGQDTEKERDIVERASKFKAKWICITGGEPFEQDLQELIMTAHSFDMMVQVETSGLFWDHCAHDVDWLCVSPKDLYSINKQALVTIDEFFHAAHEFKCLITKESDVDFYLNKFGHFTGVKTFQPVDNSPAIASMIKDKNIPNWRITCQQQKVFGLR